MPTVQRPFHGNAGGKFEIHVKNSERVLKELAFYEKKANAKMRIVVKKALLMVEAEAKRIITKVGYYPSHPKSDIIDTGTLKGRVTNQIVAFSFTNIEGRVGTNVYYAIYVHEGTTSDVSRIFNRWLMAPRPFLVDALRNKEKEIVDMILKTYKSITW